jgi:hypothetical protein
MSLWKIPFEMCDQYSEIERLKVLVQQLQVQNDFLRKENNELRQNKQKET